MINTFLSKIKPISEMTTVCLMLKGKKLFFYPNVRMIEIQDISSWPTQPDMKAGFRPTEAFSVVYHSTCSQDHHMII